MLQRGRPLTHALEIWHALKLLQPTDAYIGCRAKNFGSANTLQHHKRVRALLQSFFPHGEHPQRLQTPGHPVTKVDPELLLLAAADTSHLISAKMLVHDYNAKGDIAPSDSETRTAQNVGVMQEGAPEEARIFFQRLGRFCGRYELSKRVRVAHCTETSQVADTEM